MKGRFARLAELIRSESEELRRLVDRAEQAGRRAESSRDDLYWDSVALNLHGFYAGLERLFERIAHMVDGALPIGADWHRKLLDQMAREAASLRPAVISEEARDCLDDYRSLRHVVRHAYPFDLDPTRLKELLGKAPAVLSRLVPELEAFAEFLTQADPDRSPDSDTERQ